MPGRALVIYFFGLKNNDDMDAILRRKNADANPNNALQIRELDGICCGDVAKALVCKYTVTIPTGTQATASKISIDGTEYGFGSAIDLTTDAGRTQLKAAIKTALASAGYTQDGVDITVSGANVTVTTNYSQAVFTFLHSGTYAFTKVLGQNGCKTVGDFNVSVCTSEATIGIDGLYIRITPFGSERITNVKVNDGAADRFNGALVTTTGTASGNSVSINGSVYLLISAFSYSGAESFTITITQECAGVSTPTALTRGITVP